MGTQQMMSVPYAMYAGSAGNSSLPQGNEPGTMLVWNGSNWETIAPPTSSHASLNWCEGEIKWGDCPAVFSDWNCCSSSQLKANLLYCPGSWLGFGMIQSDNLNLDNAVNLNFVGLNSGGGISGAGFINYPMSYSTESQYYKAYFINNNADTSWSSVYHYIPSSIQCANPLACNYDIASLSNTNCLFDNNNDGICNDSFVIQCADSNACNFSVLSTSNTFIDCIYDLDNNGSCTDSANYYCNDPAACNYFYFAYDNSECLFDNNNDGICNDSFVIQCADPNACNFSVLSTSDTFIDCIYDLDNNGTCTDGANYYCNDPAACNYFYFAYDNSECTYPGSLCDDGNVSSMNDVYNSVCLCDGIIVDISYIQGGGVIDIDGNSYSSIIINGQEWMQQNLAVSKYQNGDPIVTSLSNASWQNTTIGAYAIYNNDANYNTLYGKLYNWYAVNDNRGLCPTGWHVPNPLEWSSLETYLGGPNIAGDKLKSITGWIYNNSTNESGFTALPGGYRYYSGAYDYGDNGGFWWSNLEINPSLAFYRVLNYSDSNFFNDMLNKHYGLSVRCIKNQ
jgi:uncharacterized protein (TIGR02145 family)